MRTETQRPDYIARLGREAYVDVLGSRVRYFIAGQGRAVVLLHGLGEAAIAWHANVGPLAERFNVVSPEVPGHGASQPAPWQYSVEKSAEWLVTFLDALGLQEASLVGNSLGGLIAASAALEAPERVRRLVIEDGAGFGREVALLLRLMSLPGFGEVIGRPTTSNLHKLMRILFYDPARIPPGFVEALHRERSRPWNKAVMLQILRVGVDLRGVKRSVLLLGRLSELRMPTLVLWGRQDRIFPVSHAQRAVESLPSATLHVFDACGHWPHMEHWPTYNKLVLDFLA